MNKEIAKEWCKELRSGKYKQGNGRLNFGGKYCCLGVLCELAKKKGVIKEYSGMAGTPPESVRKWAGMRYSTGPLCETSLIHINDGHHNKNMKLSLKNGKKVEIRNGRKATFSTIAKIIESYVEEL